MAQCKGVHTSPLAADDYWRRLRKRLEDLTARPAGDARDDGTDANEEARALANAADQLVASAGHVELTFGAWHGDWTPWNMATTATTVLVWDWERFGTGVPVGYDALHFDFQRLLDPWRRGRRRRRHHDRSRAPVAGAVRRRACGRAT